METGLEDIKVEPKNNFNYWHNRIKLSWERFSKKDYQLIRRSKM